MQSITVDKFTVKWVPESDNLFSSYRWEPSFAELNAKCLYWTAFRNPDNNTEVYVNCIKEKTKFMKKEKVGNVTED